MNSLHSMKTVQTIIIFKRQNSQIYNINSNDYNLC